MKKYRPSNGSEGVWFTDKFCDQCANNHPNPDHPMQCMILCRSFCHDINHSDYPEEWQYDANDNPTCTAFKKWDWGRDDDGNWIEPEPVPPVDPNQLCLPFIFDELGIPKQQNITV